MSPFSGLLATPVEIDTLTRRGGKLTLFIKINRTSMSPGFNIRTDIINISKRRCMCVCVHPASILHLIHYLPAWG